MKHLLPLFLSACLLFTGCSIFGERISEPVTFYYVRNEYQYGSAMECVISGEQREASGHRDSLNYLMAMYFLGPVTEDLRSPLPHGTTLYSVKEVNGTVLLELSDTEASLTDIDFSLSGACLAMTCMEIADAQSVTITSGSRTITLTSENLTLYDSHTVAASEETQ